MFTITTEVRDGKIYYSFRFGDLIWYDVVDLGVET